jgi:hypothetical protein
MRFNVVRFIASAALAALASSHAQARTCATPAPSSTTSSNLSAAQSAWQSNSARLSTSDVVIPVQFHVIRETNGSGGPSDTQIFNQMDALNKGFHETRFRFALRGINYVNNSAYRNLVYGSSAESTMKSGLATSPANVLNVYVTSLNGGLLGWATFPDMFPESSSSHGVVIATNSLPGGSPPFHLGATLTHEVGHFLGLFHTFENHGGAVCSDPGDYVADTPTHQVNYGTPPATTDTCPQAGTDPVHNYMNYTDDSHMHQITNGQKDRAYGIMNTFRPTMWSAGQSNLSGLINISTRLRIEPGANAAFAGFVITGSSSQDLVITGKGPSLSAHGLPSGSLLSNPQMALFAGQSQIGSNDDWRNPTSNETAVQQSGFAPSNNLESAMRVNFSPGLYSAQISPGPGSTNGIGLVEVYNLSYNPAISRVINLSTRGLAGSGNDTMIAGFVISGGNKEVLIRAVGPTLGNFGVSGTLSNPQLTLYKGGTIIGTNQRHVDAWNSAQVASESSRVGAYPLSSADEAAMLKVLEPGLYSVHVSPETGGSGIALVEVYDTNAY